MLLFLTLLALPEAGCPVIPLRSSEFCLLKFEVLISESRILVGGSVLSKKKKKGGLISFLVLGRTC